jgi:hypothetical protein
VDVRRGESHGQVMHVGNAPEGILQPYISCLQLALCFQASNCSESRWFPAMRGVDCDRVRQGRVAVDNYICFSFLKHGGDL